MATASWSRYGSIPVSTPATAGGDTPVLSSSTAADPAAAFFARTKTRAASVPGQRPWRELTNLSSFSRPYACGEARARARRNLYYFRANYALVILVIVFLSLLWRPISMIVFLPLFAAWLFLYLARDVPIVLFSWEVDDRIVLVLLGTVTIVALALTKAGINVLVALVISAAVIGLHASFRSTDDLYVEQREATDWGLFSVVEGQHGASSSSPVQ